MRQATHPELAAADEALCRSAVYAALALGLDRPGAEVRSRLASEQGAAALQGLLLELGIEGPPLRETLQRLARGGPRDGDHDRLFGHTARGAVPPFETEYGGDTLFQQPQELSDLGGFLAAFGLKLDPGRRLRVDHVCCECELMAFLARKEAHALETADAEMLEPTRKAQRLLLRDHLGRFAPALGERLRRADPEGFYGAIGELLQAFVAGECERFEVRPGPEHLALRLAAPEDAVPMACGSAAECGLGGCPT
jgi:TorA maturation chaperone TorD